MRCYILKLKEKTHVHVEDEVEDDEDAIDITEEAFLSMIKL